MKRQRNEWLTTEIRLLEKVFPARMSMDEIAAMFPRHSRASVERKAHSLGITRRRLRARPEVRWIQLRGRLQTHSMSREEAAVFLGVTASRAQQILSDHRRELHIAGWRAPVGKGHWTALWAYGVEPDAPRPFRRLTPAAIEARKATPFSVAAGHIAPRDVPVAARVFQQDW